MSSKAPALYVKAAIRKYVNEKGFNIAKEVLSGTKLNNKIKKILDEAMENAKGQKRKTLMAKDC